VSLVWWLAWACAVPMAAYVVLIRLFPPRLRRRFRFGPEREPAKVIAVRVWPEAGGLPAGRREIES
jgi:hypothetical protein